jgi:hypothetical protein
MLRSAARLNLAETRTIAGVFAARGLAFAPRAGSGIREECSMRRFSAGWLALLLAAPAWAGPYSITGISAGDPAIVGWASGVSSLIRGPQDISNGASPLASYGVAGHALGAADGTLGVVSLGDGGSITLTFNHAIVNGAGADFAVFENGFSFQGGLFTELAFVEVSSDGVNFVRFPASSLTPTAAQLGAFDPIDPSNLDNLAGKHEALVGTPFDLADVGLSFATHVRLVDVVGSIDPAFARYDKDGNAINDPWTTPFEGSGFDLDAVGVIHQTPEPTSLVLAGIAAVVGLGWRRRSRSALSA